MRVRHVALPAVAGLALLALPLGPAAQAAAPTCADGVCSVEFATVGHPESFTVPAGVTQLTVGLFGGSGGAGHPTVVLGGEKAAADGSEAGGAGGAVIVRVPVTPGQTLSVVAGGRGQDANTTDGTPAAGGYGGGGDGTPLSDGSDGAGGGGSFLFAGTQLLAAVGGGGGGGYQTGGAAGAGGAGTDGRAGTGVTSGRGATTSAPGAGGQGLGGTAGTGPAAGPATFGTGGSGGPLVDGVTGVCSSGGGGGGYFGGGSGACSFGETAKTGRGGFGAAATARLATDPRVFGGGGGGSGFLAAGVTVLQSGSTNGDGAVVVGYSTGTPQAPTTTTLTTDKTVLAPGQDANLHAAVAVGPVVAPVSTTAAAQTAAKVSDHVAAVRAAVNTPGAKAKAATPAVAGTVTFFVNGQKLGDPQPVDPTTGAVDIVFTAGSNLGLRSITAHYDGTPLLQASTSNTVSISVAGLANTGPGHVVPMVGASAALLVAGAGLLAFGRRRPQTGSHRAA